METSPPHEDPRPEKPRITRFRIPRSCVACRSRHIKCDKTLPCTGCRKSGLECVYPKQQRKPPRPHHPDAALMGRLNRLETLIQKMAPNGVENAIMQTPPAEDDDGPPGELLLDMNLHDHQEVVDATTGMPGHLMINCVGKSRYINADHWAALSDEVDDLKDFLKEKDSGAEDPEESTSTAGFPFTRSEADGNLRWAHPSTENAEYMYQRYKAAVHPILPMIHTPTFETKFREFLRIVEDGKVDSKWFAFESLVFAVYHGAMCSVSAEEIGRRYPGAQKFDVMAHYRNAVQISLGKTNPMVEFEPLQALVIYISCMRMPIDGTPASMYTGIALQAARSQGLHRDPDLFSKVCPISGELRRRIWYQICLQDIRTAEVCGVQPMIVSSTYDTRPPMNIDDVNLKPYSNPEPQKGLTDTTRLLIQSELLDVTRMVMGQNVDMKVRVPCYEKVRAIEKARKMIIDKWFGSGTCKSCPMYQALIDMADLFIGKTLFFVYHSVRHSRSQMIPKPLADRLFEYSIESIERGIRLINISHEALQPQQWYWRTEFQAHALALLYSELTHRGPGPLIDRAWQALEIFMSTKGCLTKEQGQCINYIYWRPLQKLKTQAIKRRWTVHQPQGPSPNTLQGECSQWFADGFPASAQAVKGTGKTDKNTSWSTRDKFPGPNPPRPDWLKQKEKDMPDCQETVSQNSVIDLTREENPEYGVQASQQSLLAHQGDTPINPINWQEWDAMFKGIPDEQQHNEEYIEPINAEEFGSTIWNLTAGIQMPGQFFAGAPDGLPSEFYGGMQEFMMDLSEGHLPPGRGTM